MPDIDWNRLLQDVPGVRAEYEDEATRDRQSQRYLQQLGIGSAEDYARYWYNNMGGSSMYSQAPVTPVTPTTPPPVQTQPPPTNSTPLPTTPGTPQVVAPTSPSGNRNVQYDLAVARARQQLLAQGLDPALYLPEIENQLRLTYNIIPDTETNAGQYFDPNFAGDYLQGRTAMARNNARNMVTNSLKKPGLDYTALDGTISKLLTEGLTEGENYLKRGQQRGQFNESGLQAGRTKLESAKAKASAKLKGYASDVYGKYGSQFDDIYSRALGDANNVGIGQEFDISPYKSEYDRLSQRLTGEGLEGELLGLVGDEPLINLNDLRGGIAKGQGTTNLRDLDALEGLANRRKASEVGRGLGSQGAF
jgi:hypothetical protein